MKRSLIPLSILCGALAASGTALADHNSKNGEGWANMPNDIHNTRIETKEADDNEAFRDFVKFGEGSTSENRFLTDDTVPAQAVKQGKAQQVQNKAADRARSENRTSTRNQDRARTESRSRLHRDPSMSSQRERSAASNRSGGRRSGGKR